MLISLVTVQVVGAESRSLMFTSWTLISTTSPWTCMSNIIVIGVAKTYEALGEVEIKVTFVPTLICGGVKGIMLDVDKSTWVVVTKGEVSIGFVITNPK